MTKDSEDNRDVFDKALDEPIIPILGGVGVGVLVGNRIARRMLPRKYWAMRRERAAIHKKIDAGTDTPEDLARLRKIDDKIDPESVRRDLGQTFGGWAGGAAGYGLHAATRSDKGKPRARK